MNTSLTAPPAAPLAALYFDGRQSRPHAVELQIGAGGVAVRGSLAQREFEWTRVRISERLQHAPRLLLFDDGTSCQVDEREALARALHEAGYRDPGVVAAQRRWRYAATALVLLVAVLFAGYRWVLPRASGVIAQRVPLRAEQRLGVQAVHFFEQQLPPSRLDGEQSGRVWRLFDSIAPSDGRDYRVVLRDGGPMGANAFALPGGAIIVTDQLVRLAPDDAALLGVLAHEIGHVERRHLLRQTISRTVIGAAVAALAGDTAVLAASLPAALANLSYSREMELEADDYAVALLKERHIDVAPMADLLQRLQRQADAPQEQAGWARYLSTHPDTEERVRRIRAARG